MKARIQFPALTRPIVFKHMLVRYQRDHVRCGSAQGRADVDPDASADVADGPGEADERIGGSETEGGEADRG